MNTPWTATQKEVVPALRPMAPSNPSMGAFTPPMLVNVKFMPADLFKSVARCSAASRASAALVAAVLASAKALCEFLVEDATTTFAIVDDVRGLADAERSALSGRIGAGVTDQAMESLGYAWRDLAEEVVLSSAPLADFVYETAAGGTLVMAEAKGSITASASAGGVFSRAGRAYGRQVDPYVFTTPPAPKGRTAVGLIEHGYAVAFAALPSVGSMGPPPNGADAFLCIADTARPGIGNTVPPGGPGAVGASPTGQTDGGSSSGSPHPLIALGNYRAIFLLANAPAVVEAIDSALNGFDSGAHVQLFAQVRCGKRKFLVGVDPHEKAISGLEPFMEGRFAIAEESAEAFLTAFAKLVVTFARGQFVLPLLPVVRDSESAKPPYLLSPDGFALLRPGYVINGSRRWAGHGLEALIPGLIQLP